MNLVSLLVSNFASLDISDIYIFSWSHLLMSNNSLTMWTFCNNSILMSILFLLCSAWFIDWVVFMHIYRFMFLFAKYYLCVSHIIYLVMSNWINIFKLYEYLFSHMNLQSFMNNFSIILISLARIIVKVKCAWWLELYNEFAWYNEF